MPQLANWSPGFGDGEHHFLKETDNMNRWSGALGYSARLTSNEIQVSKDILTDTYLSCVLWPTLSRGPGRTEFGFAWSEGPPSHVDAHQRWRMEID